MTAAVRYAIRFILAGFTVFTIGMAASTFIDSQIGKGSELSYQVFGMGLALCLLSIAYAGYSVTNHQTTLGRWCIFYFILAFSNLGDEILKTASELQWSEFWLAGGLFVYIGVIAKQKYYK